MLASGGAEVRPGKIESRVLRDTANEKEASFVIHLADQADVSAAHGMKDPARGRYVYRTLKEHAERTQAPLHAMLRERGVPFRSFWVANVIFATGDRAIVEDLSARADVKVIESNAKSNWLSAERGAVKPETPNVVEPGVNNVRAPEVWAL